MKHIKTFNKKKNDTILKKIVKHFENQEYDKIIELFSQLDEESKQNIIDRVIKENDISPDDLYVINFFADELGETIDTYLGGETFGVAYSTESNKVIKITSDPVETAFAHKLCKKPWTKYLINYYSVHLIDDFEKYISKNYDDNFALIVMDRVENIKDHTEYRGDDVPEVMRFYQSLIQYKNDYYENVCDDVKFNRAVNSFMNLYVKDDRKELKKNILKYHDNMMGIVKELKKYHIEETDFHDGNIGWYIDEDTKEKRIVLFDLGGYVTNSENVTARNEHIPDFKYSKLDFLKYIIDTCRPVL